MVETQFCKLRDTSDTFVARAYSILSFRLEHIVCELTYDMVVSAQFHKCFERSVRVFYI